MNAKSDIRDDHKQRIQNSNFIKSINFTTYNFKCSVLTGLLYAPMAAAAPGAVFPDKLPA